MKIDDYIKNYHKTNAKFEKNLAKKIKKTLDSTWKNAIISIENEKTRKNIYKKDKIEVKNNLKTEFFKIAIVSSSEVKRFGNKKKSNIYTYNQKETTNISAYIKRRIEALSEKKATIINENTQKLIEDIIISGLEEGLTTMEIAKKLKDIADISNNRRSQTIARTEVHGARNEFQYDSIKEQNIDVKYKTWISALDERTRTGTFDHVNANGEKVEINEQFKNTNENLRFPGDSNGSAGNIINCRCVVIYT